MDVLKFGFKYYKRHLPLAIPALFMGFAFIGIGVLFPMLSQIIIDFVILPNDPTVTEVPILGGNVFAFLLNGSYGENGSMELMLNVFKVSVILYGIKHFFVYTRNNLYFVYGFRFEKTMRELVYSKLLTSSNFVLARYNTGDMLTILNSDVYLFRDLFMRTIPTILDTIFYIGICVFLLSRIYLPLAILPFCAMPVYVIMFIRYIKKARKINSDIRDASAKLSMNVQENINGVRIVRSFAAEDFEIKKFNKCSSHFRDRYFEQVRFNTRYGFGFNTVRHLLYTACIFVGALFVVENKISIGGFTAFIAYVFAILDGSTSIVSMAFEAQQFSVCGERIFTFVSTGNIIENPENPIPVTDKPNIKIENVTLVIDDHTILKDISIDIPYGKKLGIMGATASGKTSILKLMNRFTDPTNGNIYINGNNLKNISLSDIRREYGYVMQDVFLFSNTIDSNIAFYNIDMPHEKIIESATAAQAHGFISKMPEGYNTIVGERGIGLSGGQKQRISVARALAKDAPVILLDDVTSALDTETEKALIKSVYEKYSEKTIVITAHRASSVKDCDEIIILDNGEICERGTHSELIELNGKYADIYNQQSSTVIGG